MDPPNATSVDSSILGELSGKLGLGERVRQVENTGLAEGQQEEGLGPWTGRRQDRRGESQTAWVPIQFCPFWCSPVFTSHLSVLFCKMGATIMTLSSVTGDPTANRILMTDLNC